jgi:L-ribulose-5-phosphate 3-epimerase
LFEKGGKMKLILFSKRLKEKSVPELAELGAEFGIDGYDLAVRPGFPVSPDNVGQALPGACRSLRENGLDVPLVTGHFELRWPDHPTVEPLLRAMNGSDVRMLKLAYYQFDPKADDYQQKIDEVRKGFEGWQKLAREYGVKICYHTHSNKCLGLNAGSLAHLLSGFDPQCLGAYLDPCHLITEGERFSTAVGMVRPYLAVVSLKDALLERVERNGHGGVKRTVPEAGAGMVDWTTVFECLNEVGFDGPLSVHCEFEIEEGDLVPAIKRETAFFKRFVPKEGS